MFLIGICGSSASGKSFVSKLLKFYFEKKYKLKVQILSLDMFYKEFKNYSNKQQKDFKKAFSKDNMQKNIRQRKLFNFDDPKLIDTKYAFDVCKKIKNKENDIVIPTYYFGKKPTTYSKKNFKNIDILIVEGIFLFHEIHTKKFNKLFDYKIFVEVCDKLDTKKFGKETMFNYFANKKNCEIQMFLRRYYRDKLTRKGNINFIEYLYTWENVMKSYRKYILPYKKNANIVINNNVPIEIKSNNLKLKNIPEKMISNFEEIKKKLNL